MNARYFSSIKANSESSSTLKAPSINGRYHHVVRIDGQWAELSCKICGANYDENSQQVFKGLDGFLVHITGPAHELKVDFADVLDYCSRRAVSDRDVGIMLQSGSRKPVDCAISKRKHEPKSGSELEQLAIDAVSRTRKRQRTLDSDTSGLTSQASIDSDTVHVSSGPSVRYSSVDNPDDTRSSTRVSEQLQSDGPPARSTREQRRRVRKA